MSNNYTTIVNQRKYGCGAFLLDFFMILITGGLWIIWIIIRQWRHGR